MNIEDLKPGDRVFHVSGANINEEKFNNKPCEVVFMSPNGSPDGQHPLVVLNFKENGQYYTEAGIYCYASPHEGRELIIQSQPDPSKPSAA